MEGMIVGWREEQRARRSDGRKSDRWSEVLINEDIISIL